MFGNFKTPLNPQGKLWAWFLPFPWVTYQTVMGLVPTISLGNHFSDGFCPLLSRGTQLVRRRSSGIKLVSGPHGQCKLCV